MKSDTFKDKVIIVTGASRGIGKSLATAFAEKGAHVIINYNKSESEAASLADDLRRKGLSADPFRADISKLEESEKMIDHVVKKYSKIDVLVNNAGIRQDIYLAMMSEEEWDNVIDINLKSMFNTCKWASRVMISRRKGKIINISSVSALKGIPGQTNYSASKGGVLGFTRSLAAELGPYGIQVNAVVPGFIETDMVEGLKKEKRQEYLDKIPLGRFGSPDDVTGGVLFLASENSDYITGSTLAIDGGLT